MEDSTLMSDIKNTTIENKLIEATNNDDIMQNFLLTIVGNEYKTTHYNKVYNEALEIAVKAYGEK